MVSQCRATLDLEGINECTCVNSCVRPFVCLCANSLRAVIAAWLNASRRNRIGARVNRSARGRSGKRFARCYEMDTALYKNKPLPFYITWPISVVGMFCKFPPKSWILFYCMQRSSWNSYFIVCVHNLSNEPHICH